MTVSFFLTRPRAVAETSIFARISYSGHKLKYYIPEKINPKFWNKDNQRAKQSDKFREYPEFNARLNNILVSINNTYRKCINDNAGVIPNPETLKVLLDREIKRIQPDKTKANTFLSFFQEIIDYSKTGIRLHPKTGKPISKNTLKTYVTTLKHLNEYQGTTKKKIDFDIIDLDFYTRYTEYLMKGKRINPETKKTEPLNLSTNTVGKHIQVIKMILNEATERGLNSNLSFKSKRFVTLREKSDSIYLSEKEIKELENLDLNGHGKMERVRDLFVIGCYTGLRYSDYSILKPSNIKDGFIETTQMKTGEPVVIPIHPTVKRIIDKYSGNLPRSISNQKTNEYLKDLGKKLDSLKSEISKTMTKGGLKTVRNFAKWELLTSHTARRSFATNEFLAGTPTLTIMAITGHKTEKAFLKYIKLTPTEHAKLLKLQWNKRHSLQIV
ncbi:MAG: site-specific integrase [Flavisolibacter sp.]